MKQKLIPSSINDYMVGFVHSLYMQSDLNPKKKVYPFSGDGVFFVPDCMYVPVKLRNLQLTLQDVIKSVQGDP